MEPYAPASVQIVHPGRPALVLDGNGYLHVTLTVGGVRATLSFADALEAAAWATLLLQACTDAAREAA